MKKTALTTAEIRRFNRSQIYKAIYDNKQISKQGIGYELQISLPTVSQNLSELQEAGLIEICGSSESTGGRKAQLYRCIAHLQHGRATGRRGKGYDLTVTVRRPHRFAELRFVFGKILNNENVTLEHFTRYLDYPCILLHDSETAATYELWKHPDIKDAAFLLLNRNLGGAPILDGSIHSGSFLTSGIFEHMCLVPKGRLCYCGQHGCLETYCSAEALMTEADMSLEGFFKKNVKMRSGTTTCTIWHWL